MYTKRCSIIVFILFCKIFAGNTQKPFYDELSDNRTITASVASVGPYALFGGGYVQDESGNFVYSSRVDIFDYRTRNWTTTEFSNPKGSAFGTSAGKYALFVGGFNKEVFYNGMVEIWNSNTSEWTQKALPSIRSITPASVGRYALFAGGFDTITANYTTLVNIFNSDNEEWTTTELSEGRVDITATSVGPYAMFACGNNGVNTPSVVDLFHQDTLQMTSISFPQPRLQMGATSVGPLAMFAGGGNGTLTIESISRRVDIWNYQTNEWTIDYLSTPRMGSSAASNGKFAFFGPLSVGKGVVGLLLNIDIYNYETKQWITTDMSQPRTRVGSVSVGPFVLYAGGGLDPTLASTSRVDIWQLCNTTSDCVDDGLFCTDVACVNGLCDYSLDHCRNSGECNNTCNEQAKNCFTPLGSTCGENWCAGKLCDGTGTCSYSKPRCLYDNSTSITCQECDSERESCFRMEGEDCLVTGAIAGKCDDIGHCTERKIAEKKSSKTGLIVGVVIGVAALLCIVIGAIVFVLRRRRNKRRNEGSSNNIELTSSLTGIVIEHKLGGGNFGEVYKGTWNGTTAVALKKLKDQTQLKEFEQEAAMLQSLQHPNIVRYLGIHKASDGILYIVTEYISDGSLLTVVHQNAGKFDSSSLASFGAQAASGMAYLGSKGIIHRDLSLRNLLASKRDSNNQKYQVYVSDFGLSRAVAEGGYYRSADNHIPVKWSAPEAIEYGFFTIKSDVWSFGILLWELFSGGKQPYPGISNSELLDKLNSGYRLPQPAGCPDEVYQLMQDCWKKNPEERPTFQEAFSVLSNGETVPIPTNSTKFDASDDFYLNT